MRPGKQQSDHRSCDTMQTHVVIAARSPAWSFQPLVMGCRRTKDSRSTTRTRPASIALTAFACCWARRTASVSWVTIMSRESCSKLFLTELLRLMQTDDKLLRAEHGAIHRVHRGSSYSLR